MWSFPNAALVLAATTAFLASACEEAAPEGEGVPEEDAPPLVAGCGSDADCVAGELCLSATCVVAECDPLIEDACDAGEIVGSHCCGILERCSALSFNCEAELDVGPCNPADITCVQCTTQEQCSAGQVCSSGLCLDAAGREQCTATFQCPDGEHCDVAVFLCVPLRPCEECSPQSPHLCCFDGEVCLADDAGGLCTIPAPPECEVDIDCAPGLFCGVTRQCVQCDDTGDCGPGLFCDVEEGLCASEGTCIADAECPPDQRCAPQTRACVVPDCEEDADCFQTDPRLFCDTGTFLCELADPVCVNDLDEENDSAQIATAIELGVPFTATLCRGDADFLAFPVEASTRYTATVELADGVGTIVTMLNGALEVESTTVFASGNTSVTVAGVTSDTDAGSMFLALDGNSNAADQWDYVVTVVASAP